MAKFLNLVLSGAVTGAIYSIMASGLVLTYTTSGIFNFAHGAIAFSVAYLYYQLHDAGMPIVPAVFISAFLFAPFLGYLLNAVLFRRLATAPVYARIVGTVGLLVALPALVQWLVVTVGIGVFHLDLAGNEAIDQGARAPGLGPTPPHVYHLTSNVALNSDQVAVFIAAAGAAALLWFVLRRTRVGLEMRAVVDREPLAGLRGINAARTSAIAWMLTMVLAGLGGVLVAPLFNLSDIVFTLVVLGSLAAVVLGGLRSLPIAFVGGLLLGVVQNLVAGYNSVLPKAIADLTGLRSAVPYLLVLVLGLIFGRDRTRQAGSVAEDRPPVDHRQGMSPFRRRLPWTVFTIGLLAYSMHWFGIAGFQANAYDQSVIAQSLAMAIVFLSFVIVTGIGGMVSLAQATFVTAGAFAAGWALSRDWGIDIPLIASGGQLNFVWAALIGSLVAAAVGMLIAVPSTRLGAVYFAIWSLAAAFFCSLVPFAWDPIGKGQAGWVVRSPSFDVPGVGVVHRLLTGTGGHFDFSNSQDQIVLFLALFGMMTLFVHGLLRSASGRAMLAVRSSHVAAQASGIRANQTKVKVVVLSAAFAGLGGVMVSFYSSAASNSTAPPYVGLLWLAMAVLFGIRRPGGALLAGFAFGAGTAVFHWVASVVPGGTVTTLVSSVYFVPILSGLGAINLAQEPDGLLSLVGHQRLARGRAKERRERIASVEAAVHGAADDRHPPPAPPASARPAAPVPDAADGALVLREVVAGYGEVEVLHGVSLALQGGEVVALLGANGAGKSTLCAVAAGLVLPSAGTISLAAADMSAATTHVRARAGLMLIPEARGVFPGLTVEENLDLVLRDPALREQAYERFPILRERRRQAAGLLSGGEQQLLSLAPAIIDPPAVLVADEPTLGLAPLAAAAVIDAILELRDRGSAILLVEEFAQHALAVADTIAFMELGTITWMGPAAEADLEELSAAYLGRTAP